ncbi:MAG: toxin-antitoxin system HicB family antitoxin [Planctomycetota bacterium]
MLVHTEGFEGRCQKVLQVARELYQSKPDWVTFFRETLGVNGAARSVFTTQTEYISFEQRPEYNDIQQMVASLRNRKIPGNGSNEPTRVITVRLPESLHEALKAEAADHNTSMNKLCISKLLQVLIENEKNAAAANAATAPRAHAPVPAPVPAPRTNVPPVPKPSVPVGASRPAPVPQPSQGFRSTYEPRNDHRQGM